MNLLQLISSVICFAPLLTDPSKYTNFESAVNPEYYFEHIHPFKKGNYGYPIVHRKIGLSKGNEKIVYENWLKIEFRNFMEAIHDYLCETQNWCMQSKNLQNILIKLKNDNVIVKEEFLSELLEEDFVKTCNNIVDIIDKYFDVGYHHYEHLRAMVSEASELVILLNYNNTAKVDKVINKIISICNGIDSYYNDLQHEKDLNADNSKNLNQH